MSRALPTPEQIAWADCGVGVIIHLDIQVFEPEYDFRQSWGYTPDPRKFNPEKLDTDQWLEAARSLGARYAVLVAKHCSGFSLWPTGAHDYSVRSSRWRGGRGDIVRDFIASCRRCGVLPGLYCSTGCNAFFDVDDVLVRSGDAALQERYNQIVYLQLDELWGRYGELFEIWFDGGVAPRHRDRVEGLLDRLQPRAVCFQGPRSHKSNLRWPGNEDGQTPYPCWAATDEITQEDGAAAMPGLGGNPDGSLWAPAECDMPCRAQDRAFGGGWFWRRGEDELLHPLDYMVERYYRSVGRNGNLLLGMVIDDQGLVPAADCARFSEFGREIARRFSAPKASCSGNGLVHELALESPAAVTQAVIAEDIRLGERVREYSIEAWDRGAWRPAARGSCVGHKRIERFAPAASDRFRLNIGRAASEPAIREFAVY